MKETGATTPRLSNLVLICQDLDMEPNLDNKRTKSMTR
jgi:hypothetical protein